MRENMSGDQLLEDMTHSGKRVVIAVEDDGIGGRDHRGQGTGGVARVVAHGRWMGPKFTST